MKLVVCVLLICFCIVVFTGCCSTSESDGGDIMNGTSRFTCPMVS